MCGIVGFVSEGRYEARAEVLRRMTASLAHRGPDDEAMHLDDDVALGARRLSVIDLRGGRQPMTNEDRSLWIVHNGEIYNFAVVRDELERRGYRFRTRSDTEVVLHAYEAYGEECVQHLDGMFAFAIWDVRNRALFLARDRMGEKPLYYYAGPQVFVFGSELRAVVAHPAVPRVLSLESLCRYLAFEYVPDPDCILFDVAKLPPGHILTLAVAGKPHVSPYWDLTFTPDSSVSERRWIEELRARLETSVRERLVSDVPVGVFLSGGLDSSAIAATAARVNASTRIKSFSVGFAEPSYDERRFARLVAAHCHTEHHELVFSAADARALLADVGAIQDEPLTDSSLLPIYALSRFARESVTVVLSGDGGDELFCGYPTFLAEGAAGWFRRAPRWISAAAARLADRLRPSSRYGSVEFLLKQFFRGLPHSREIRTQLLLGGLPEWEQSWLLSPDVRAACAGFDPYDGLMTSVAEMPGLSPMERLIYQHCKFYLAGQNLVTVDRASMACGLEVRAPFLARGLVQLASMIPSEWKVRGWVTKYILKAAFRDRLPRTIVDRRKQGFGVPTAAWLRGPLRDLLLERLARDRVARHDLFDPSAIDRLVREHLDGTKDHRKLLWGLLMFEAWYDHYRPTHAAPARSAAGSA